MSTTTDKLALFKYDPSTDGAQTFNIKKALNDNWDKLDDAVKEILITLAKYGYGGNLPLVKWSSQSETEEEFDAKLDALIASYNDRSVFQALLYPPFWYGSDPMLATIYKHSANSVSVQAFSHWSTSSTYTKGTGFRRVKTSNGWQPWEWVNPPMALGVEYRTVYRYLGKPVYVKLVDCGALPNATYKDVQFAGSEARPISVSCTSGATACTATLPTMASGGSFGDGHKIDVSLANYNQIRIVSDANQSGFIGYALVKYWKTID